MNIIKKFGCRAFQTAFKLAIPLMPYREPTRLLSNEEVCNAIASHGKSAPMIVTDKGLTKIGLCNELVQSLLSHNFAVSVFDGVMANPTIQNVEKGVEAFKKAGCDCIIAFGGGSAMDCAKGMGARLAKPKKSIKKMKGLLKVCKRLPLLIAVPTTAGTGSETTVACVLIDEKTKHKIVINDFSLIPKYAMLMPSLTTKIPPFITATTGMDALTHAIEAYVGRSTTKKTRAKALEAIAAIFENLPIVFENGENVEARGKMLEASFSAGVAFTISYVGYVHALSHAISGQYGVAHGEANACLLPHVLNMYGTAVFKKLKEIAVHCGMATEETNAALASRILLEKIEGMNKSMGIPLTINQLKKCDVPLLAERAFNEATPLYPTPILLTKQEIEKMFEFAISLQEVKND